MAAEKMQEARLTSGGYILATVLVPAFPDNPQIIQLESTGQLFGNGTVGYGVSYLTYTWLGAPYLAISELTVTSPAESEGA